MKKAIKITTAILIFYTIYFLYVFAISIKFNNYKESNINYNVDDIKKVSTDNIYANILENPKESFDIRLDLINKANENINVSYLNILTDTSGKIFYGALLNKANEGVKVNILLDGFNIKRNKYFKTVVSHPNINYYLFEPTNLLNPKTINNTLHDKFITIDSKYTLLGGRNISDRFFIKGTKEFAYDRDILLFNENESLNVINDIDNYFNEVINHKYTKKLNYKRKKSYSKLEEKLINKLSDYKKENVINYYTESLKVDNATFVRSPLNRGNKEPILYNLIDDLSVNSNNIIIQSPYITTSKIMEKHFKLYNDKSYTFITNNMNSNPNMPTLSNYVLIREKIAKDSNLYELQINDSNHAKSVIIDDDISIIGSQNLDNRSVFLSTESMIVVYDKEFNKLLNKSFNKLIDTSLKVNEDGSYLENEEVTEIKKKRFKMVMVKTISFVTRFFKELLTKSI